MQTGIRERAMQAYQERQQANALTERNVLAQRSADLGRKLKKVLDIDADPTDAQCDIDGVTFCLVDHEYGSDLAVAMDDDVYSVNDWADVGTILSRPKVEIPFRQGGSEIGPSPFDKHLAQSTNNACLAEQFNGGENVSNAEVALICSNLSVAAAMRALAVEMHSYHDFVAYSQ